MPNWREVLEEFQKYQIEAVQSPDLVRRKYLDLLYKHTGRNVISYYSGFLSKPYVEQSGITDEDKNGFMMTINNLDRTKGLDLILHTQGGELAATESIVDYLRRMFGHDIRAIVPQIAMSAGTMIACSCREIVMSKHSNLGPIDPHLRDIPAVGVIKEFKRACREVKRDSSKIPIWQSIIRQYRPTFLSQCENAIQWSKQFVEEQLKSVMFEGLPNANERAKKVVRKLTDYSRNKSHNRHIHIDECQNEIGLVVSPLENDPILQDLVLTIHHCNMHVFQNTLAYKMIENHLGLALVKNIALQKN
jgi:ATP-dependent protease ClpP protease subunit